MAEALALNLNSEEPRERHLRLAGPETEAREHRPTEAFRTNQITINLPEDSSELKSNIVFFSARA
ncbi:MAG: hypothetical protein K6T91_00735 [Firmicutes bacterium]|nr:hypothetical protein [Bacillota bacterium]